MHFLLEKSAGRHLFYSAMVILPENNTGYKNSNGAMLTPLRFRSPLWRAMKIKAKRVAQGYPQAEIGFNICQ